MDVTGLSSSTAALVIKSRRSTRLKRVATNGGQMQRVSHFRRGVGFDFGSPSASGSLRKLRQILVKVLAVGFLLAVCALAGTAQEFTANIVGTVVDPTKAPIQGATVSATDVDRGTVRTATTNDAGAFSIPNVPVGTYEIKVEAKGFQGAKQPAMTLVMNQTARLEFEMRVGAKETVVEV